MIPLSKDAWSRIDIKRVALVVAAASAFWIGIQQIIPEKYHHIGMVLFGAIQAAITIIMNAEKKNDSQG